MTRKNPQLYLASPNNFDADVLAKRLGWAFSNFDVACVLLRYSGQSVDHIKASAKVIRSLCHKHDCAILIEEHYKLVSELGLDGVHLNNRKHQRDARQAVGTSRTVGVFCEASSHEGMTAAEAGADYISFGPLTADELLYNGQIADISLFEWWSKMIEVPVVAEGGINNKSTFLEVVKYADFVIPDPSTWIETDDIIGMIE